MNGYNICVWIIHSILLVLSLGCLIIPWEIDFDRYNRETKKENIKTKLKIFINSIVIGINGMILVINNERWISGMSIIITDFILCILVGVMGLYIYFQTHRN